MNITFAGDKITLLGNQVKKGDKAPAFTATKNDLSDFKSEDLLGKVVVYSIAPSLDTSVCAIQAKKFNKDALDLSDDVRIVTITEDLPFAQARFCSNEDIKNLEMVSDYKEREFGNKYGFLIDELKLLTRGIVIVDKEGVIQYVEYVPEVTNEVDFATALAEVKKLI
ncbi:thiol peroxidase [uncultured Anaerococcus sp.]|uniref:thiol peroxidase n=1 Tax=uncultured Anaerococcus sp. TaxID=293428 RepID=UPI0026244426|nr:thiol peroxidase [uncultured Anaerococcus sp.]